MYSVFMIFDVIVEMCETMLSELIKYFKILGQMHTFLHITFCFYLDLG